MVRTKIFYSIFSILAVFVPVLSYAQVLAPSGFPDAVQCSSSVSLGAPVATYYFVDNTSQFGSSENVYYNLWTGGLLIFDAFSGSTDVEDSVPSCDVLPLNATDTSVLTLVNFGGSNSTSTAGTSTISFIDNPDESMAYAVFMFLGSMFLMIWLMRRPK